MQEALEGFGGVHRRLELRYDGEIKVIDDYGHHPTEIKATLAAVRSMCQGRIVVAFQPHRYTRTKGLLEEFTTSFNEADVLIVTEIYAASEEPIEGVTGEMLAERIRMSGHKHVMYVSSKKEVYEKIVGMAQPGDMIVTLGAGDIVKLSDALASLWSGKA
jgi:UDP-N-acetylmuramate--alanine ligase